MHIWSLLCKRNNYWSRNLCAYLSSFKLKNEGIKWNEINIQLLTIYLDYQSWLFELSVTTSIPYWLEEEYLNAQWWGKFSKSWHMSTANFWISWQAHFNKCHVKYIPINCKPGRNFHLHAFNCISRNSYWIRVYI